MKIVTVNGSPRGKGSTNRLIEEALNGIKSKNTSIETINYQLGELELNPCIGCERCMKGLKCKYDGDDISKIIEDLLTCDIVLFGSPIYFSQLTSQAKSVIDRFYYVFTNEDLEFNADLVLFLTHGFPDKSYLDYLEYTSKRSFELAGFNVKNGLTVGDLHDIGEIDKTKKEALKKAYEIGEKLIS